MRSIGTPHLKALLQPQYSKSFILNHMKIKRMPLMFTRILKWQVIFWKIYKDKQFNLTKKRVEMKYN